MANSISNNSLLGNVSSAAARYLPEPASTGMGLFKDVMNAVRGAAGGFIGGVPTSSTGDFADLIALQIEAQEKMQTTTMLSNIEKSKHESKMSALRNIRVS